MNTHRKIEYAIFLFGLGGFLFSGYLSVTKFLTETCAIGGACPLFLGVPACYFGFAMFTIITLFAGLHVLHKFDGKKANIIVLGVATLGVLFAGYFTLLEIPLLLQKGVVAYIQGLPTCALGLIFYGIIGYLSLRLRKDFNR